MPKIFAAAIFSYLLSLAAAAETGSVCISPIPVATGGTKSLSNNAASSVPYDFTVSFNGNRPLHVSHTAPLSVQGLSLASRHTVQIKQAGQPKESFTFRFSEHKTDSLCLWFNPLYETWSLTPPGRMRQCHCNG